MTAPTQAARRNAVARKSVLVLIRDNYNNPPVKHPLIKLK